ncbi:DUF2264 domain-containing protein [Nonomuraea wenchangensis]|uniref:DUF2264 domain-containing protein n=1 Tax=Nonomuraea wenchangensis TaxID=568860 RepID=A0A1I0KKZ2_9ACTN|nr:DUF2264 domain-containing protein [Nonomuraea wenchangensis]SEU25837.1 hypothetical protein SAMN05421811_108334 [Nonomuraea wenchangensis]
MPLPPPDLRLSPRTGWTRAHWEAMADRLLDAVVPYATDGFAQYRLPGSPSRSGPVSDGLEGFARTFLLAAFRIAGAGGDVPPVLLERYAEGLAAGTDPAHPCAWPPLADMSQPLVEAASIALALHETRPWLYDRLAPAVRDRVLAWLAGFLGRRTPDNNWVLFQVVVEQFLAEAGGPYEPAEIAAGLERIEDWYTGDGWYSDGKGKNYDYYTGWALHLYPSLWARMSGDTARQERYAARLRLFLERYQHFFAAGGGPVHQGRSLVYRFATVAPLWLGELTGASPLPPGRTRRIASGVLRHFAERGAPDEHGLLTRGWYAPFPPGTQDYSGPASPYWASKAFLGLLLPPDHPAWTAPEEAAPIDLADQVVPVPPAGWLLHATRADGVVRLLNHGSDRDRVQRRDGEPDPLYLRLAYTSHTGPDFAPGAADNQLAVVSPEGVPSRRRRIEPLAVGERVAASAYQDGDVRVVTTSVVDGPAEIRVHQVTAPAGHLVRDGGHALADRLPPGTHTEGVRAVARRPDGLTSAARGLHGFTSAGVVTGDGVNAFGPCSATPYVTCPAHPGGTAVYVSLILLTAAPGEPPLPEVRVTADEVVVTPSTGGPVRVPLREEPGGQEAVGLSDGLGAGEDVEGS